MTDKVLFVDDDPHILQAYQRGLRREYRVETAQSAQQALEMIASQGPYAVVVSDMRMPGMDGIQFLAKARDLVPQTVRMMLTGCGDQQTAIEAVNEGHIFRFLTKPCPAEAVGKALAAAVEQYRLITAEKELLERTLRGSVKVLTDVLALANPTAFGRASRVRRLVQRLCGLLAVEPLWPVDLAAMLSQIGCVSLPPQTVDKLYRGEPLGSDESQMFAAHPSLGSELVANIPRLERVAQIIAYQEKHFDGGGIPADGTKGEEIPLGARILKVALDFDTLQSQGLADLEAFARLRRRANWYDPEVLQALQALLAADEHLETRMVRVQDLTGQMILAQDVITTSGAVLVTKGQQATASLRQRLKNFSRNLQIRDPICVILSQDIGLGELGGVYSRAKAEALP